MSVEKVLYPCKFDGSLQPAMFRKAEGGGARPLLVALHTWSGDHTQDSKNYSKLCEEKNWNFIFPEFRGPNWNPDGCASDLVVSDLEDAVAYMKQIVDVDPARVYLAGGSGGGHCTLLMAGRRPDLWTAVSAWCPISDLAAWFRECRISGQGYADHIVSACGGDPTTSETAGKEARRRSPLTWMRNAMNLPVDINTGIHDGHRGSVPVSQAIRAFNELAASSDRISEEDIEFICTREAIPEHLKSNVSDPAYGTYAVLFRRQSNRVRLTLFEGGHDIVPEASADWLERQSSGTEPDWGAGKATKTTGKTELGR